MKKTISRQYVLDTADQRHTITATSATDLVEQVKAITSNKQAIIFSKLAWEDDTADLRGGGVRLVTVGATYRETWRILPPLKTSDQKAKKPKKQKKLGEAENELHDKSGGHPEQTPPQEEVAPQPEGGRATDDQHQNDETNEVQLHGFLDNNTNQ